MGDWQEQRYDVFLEKGYEIFRETTSGHTVVMGGNTLRSLPNQKPLKNRVNIVLTRGQVCDECVVVRSFDELKNELKVRENTEDIYIMGGGAIYNELIDYCDEALVTKVDAIGGADVFFPNLDKKENFVCVDQGEPIDDNGYTIYFTRYQNTAKKPL